MGTKDNILSYIKGSKRGRNAHRMERDALNDPFLYDALEGLEQSGDHQRAIDDLRQKINGHVEADRHYLQRMWRQSQRYSAILVPAMVAVVLVAAPVVFLSQREEAFSLADYQHTFILEEEALPVYSDAPPAPPQVAEVPLNGDEFIIIEDNIRITDRTIVSLPEEAIGEEGSSAETVQMDEYLEAKPEEEVVDEDIPFTIVENKPKFMGGDENKFIQWVAKNLVYPESAKEKGLQGRVVTEFVIDKDGRIVDLKILRSIAPELDREAFRVISTAPQWTPGLQYGKPVRVRYIFPVNFILKQ